MKKLKQRTCLFKYISALLLFGTNGIVASFINLSSYEIVLLRTLIGSIFLSVIFLTTKNKPTFHKKKKDLLYLIISGTAMGTSWIFLYEAYSQIGVSIASLLYYCGPVIVIMLSPFLFKEKLTVVKILCFLAVLFGIILLNNSICGNNCNLFGILCGIMSAIMYSFMVIFNKKATSITGLEGATIQITVSFISSAVFIIFKQGFFININISNIIPILILGIVNTGIGCYLYFSSIKRLNVQAVAICGYLEPFSAVIFSVIFLSEAMLPIQIMGALFILGGAICGEILASKQ